MDLVAGQRIESAPDTWSDTFRVGVVIVDCHVAHKREPVRVIMLIFFVTA